MMTKDSPVMMGKLAEWLRSAVPGHCPCGQPLPQRRMGPKDEVRLCGAPGCRKRYAELYQQDRSGENFLRDVVAVEAAPEKPQHRRVHFACGHTEDLTKSLAKRVGRRRRCPTCAADAPPATPEPSPGR